MTLIPGSSETGYYASSDRAALIAYLQLNLVMEETPNAPVPEGQHPSSRYGRVVLLSLEDQGQISLQICNCFFFFFDLCLLVQWA